MPNVWWTGEGHSYRITATQWAQAGITSGTTEWNADNGWSINEAAFTSDQLALLSAQGDFSFGNEGPRLRPGPFDRGESEYSAYIYYAAIMAIYNDLIENGIISVGVDGIVGAGVAGKQVLAAATAADIRGILSAVSSSELTSAINGLIDAAPGALNTLNELAAALNDDPNFATTITNLIGEKADDAATTAALALKAPLANPTFTGTVNGVTKGHVGLGNVDNTADSAKPVSTLQQAALDTKADASATSSALALKAPLASPAFTGTPTGITKSHVGLGNVDNTSDINKPVSTAQQTALDGKQNVDTELAAIASLTSAANKLAYFTGVGTADTTDFTSFARTILAASNAIAVRSILSVSAKSNDIFNVIDYGAKGDNATDDTAAIQACVDAAEARIAAVENARVTVRFPAGRYVVNGGLTVQARDIHFVGDSMLSTRIRRGGDLSEVPVVTVNAQNFSIENMMIYNATEGAWGGDVNGQRTVAVRMERPVGEFWDNSIDASFHGCHFSGFYICLQIVGQGLTVLDCEFVRTYHGVDLDFPDAILPEKDENQRYPETGFRTFRFESIRMHAVVDGFVRNVGVNAQYLRSFLMSNVVADVGATLWVGVMAGAHISNFVVENSDASVARVFDLTDVYGSVITSGRIVGRKGGTSKVGGTYSERSANNIVYVTGTINDLRFSDVYVENIKQHGFVCVGPVHNLQISNCHFKHVGYSGSGYRHFRFENNDTQAYLSDVVFDVHPTSNITAIGQLAGNSQTIIICDNVRWADLSHPGTDFTPVIGGTVVINRRSGGVPVSGHWNRGDMLWNRDRDSYDDILGWMCITAGDPGTWQAFYAGAGVGP